MNAHEAFNNFFKSKRDQYLVEIRKQKNDKHILTKRMKLMKLATENKQDVVSSSSTPTKSSEKIQKLMEDISISFKNALESGDLDFIAEVAEVIRKSISHSEQPPLFELVKTEIVPYIMELLDPKYYHNEKLMHECSWIMTNIASGRQEYVQYLVDLDMLPKALNLFSHPSIEVKENAVWILSNIAGEDCSFRDQLIERDIVKHIENLLSGCDNTVEESFLIQVAWLIADLVRAPTPEFELIQPFLTIIKYLFVNYNCELMLNYCLWSISSISDGDSNQIQEVLNMKCNKRIIEMLKKNDLQIQAHCLKIIGNLLTGTDDQTQLLLDDGVLEALVPHLSHKDRVLRRDTVWAISNIMAGNHVQLEAVFNYNQGEILERLLYMIEHDDIGVSKECILCLTNACSAATIEQFVFLTEYKLIELLVKVMENGDLKLIKACLEALECLLSEAKKNAYLIGFDQNQFLIRLANCGGYQVIENLQSHKDDHIYNAVSRLIDDYFSYEL